MRDESPNGEGNQEIDIEPHTQIQLPSRGLESGHTSSNTVSEALWQKKKTMGQGKPRVK